MTNYVSIADGEPVDVLMSIITWDQVHFTDQVNFRIHMHRRARARAREVMIKKNCDRPVVRLMDLIHNLNVMQESKQRGAISGNWDVRKIDITLILTNHKFQRGKTPILVGGGGGQYSRVIFLRLCVSVCLSLDCVSVYVIVFRLCVSVCDCL